MVAIDIAQVFFSSDHVRMFAAMDQALLRAHFVFNLQLTGKTLLIEDSVPVIKSPSRAASVFDANVSRPAPDTAPRSYEG